MSGGNKRKLCIALALLNKPKLIFMDEMSNGVDPVSRKNIYKYLRSLTDTSILLITHRVDEVEKICDKIAIMNEGAFAAYADPKSLKDEHGLVYLFSIEPSLSNPDFI